MVGVESSSKITIAMIREVRRHCSAGVEACRQALIKTDGDIAAALAMLKSPEELKRDEAWLRTRAIVPSSADGPPTPEERAFLEAQRATRPDPEAVRMARERHERFVAERTAEIAARVRMTPDPEEGRLAADLQAARDVGQLWFVVCELHGQADHDLVADALAREAGLSMRASWTRLASSLARPVVRALLTTDLAYGAPCMGDADADALCARLFAPLGPGTVYLSNNDAWNGREFRTIRPITPNTFDAAVVAVDERRAWLLCVGDED
jgi:hypothetical protein